MEPNTLNIREIKDNKLVRNNNTILKFRQHVNDVANSNKKFVIVYNTNNGGKIATYLITRHFKKANFTNYETQPFDYDYNDQTFKNFKHYPTYDYRNNYS